MLPFDLEQVNEQYLSQLCLEKCSESETLDFKRELPGNSDKDKHEFLKDVCALANAGGGDLVYGMEESNGAADSLVPLTSEIPDAAKRRLGQILDAGLDPRVPGVRLHHVDVTSGYVLIVRVPPSFDGPHCIRTNNNRRFVLRNGTVTTDMTYDQIRQAFDRTGTLVEKARRFIEERHDLVAARRTPTPMGQGPVWLLHLVPLEGIAERRKAELRDIYSKSFDKFIKPGWGGVDRTFNFDGLVIYPGKQPDGFVGYTHIFRNGSMEAAGKGGYKSSNSNGSHCYVPSQGMSEFFYFSAKQLLTESKSWGFSGPALLGIALLDIQGYQLSSNSMEFFSFNRVTADRPHLLPPAVWIDNISTANVDDAIPPVLDVIWQAFGKERCPDFDATTGAYSPGRK